MLISMTGFGEGQSESDAIAVTAEIRSINNRHLKISFRSSDGYQSLESRVDSLLRENLSRGTVQLSVRIERLDSGADYVLDDEVLVSYQEQLAKLQSDASNKTPIELAALLTLPGVVKPPSSQNANPEADWPTIKQAIEVAVSKLSLMRKSEGEALAKDLSANCKLITSELTSIEARAPQVAEEYRIRLHERVGQVLEKFDVGLEANDIVREVALFVDRSDISEETVRLRSHIEQFESTLAEGENSGRKLEFIAQEMGRETNTIGSKASDTQISAHVVEIKAALERVREQIQNVE